MSAIQIKITFNPATKEVNVEGPLGDKILCLGMLQAAMHTVADFDPAKAAEASPAILLPSRPSTFNGHRG